MDSSTLLTDADRRLLGEVNNLLQSLVETLEILEDPETMASLRKSEEDLKSGRTRSYGEFREELKRAGEL